MSLQEILLVFVIFNVSISDYYYSFFPTAVLSALDIYCLLICFNASCRFLCKERILIQVFLAVEFEFLYLKFIFIFRLP